MNQLLKDTSKILTAFTLITFLSMWSTVSAAEQIQLGFKLIEGDDRGTEFAVFQDGTLLQEVKFRKAAKSIELAIKSRTPRKPARFAICLPSWSNPKLTSIKIRNESTLDQAAVPERVYVALGDSVSHGTGQGSATYKTWPFLLSQQLGVSLYNLAVGGGKISPPAAAMLSEFERVDLITILIGYNDWNSGVSPEDFQKQYTQALASIAESHPQARVVCVTPTFTSRKESQKSSHNLEEFCQAIRNAVQDSSSTQIKLIEGTELTSDENLRTDSDDPVHFSEKGARLFADAMGKLLATEE